MNSIEFNYQKDVCYISPAVDAIRMYWPEILCGSLGGDTIKDVTEEDLGGDFWG